MIVRHTVLCNALSAKIDNPILTAPVNAQPWRSVSKEVQATSPQEHLLYLLFSETVVAPGITRNLLRACRDQVHTAFKPASFKEFQTTGAVKFLQTKC
jgi:hypothetical protein